MTRINIFVICIALSSIDLLPSMYVFDHYWHELNIKSNLNVFVLTLLMFDGMHINRMLYSFMTCFYSIADFAIYNIFYRNVEDIIKCQTGQRGGVVVT